MFGFSSKVARFLSTVLGLSVDPSLNFQGVVGVVDCAESFPYGGVGMISEQITGNGTFVSAPVPEGQIWRFKSHIRFTKTGTYDVTGIGFYNAADPYPFYFAINTNPGGLAEGNLDFGGVDEWEIRDGDRIVYSVANFAVAGYSAIDCWCRVIK